MVRYDVPDHPPVRTGVGVSIGVGFGVEMMSHRMVFTAAGCDFLPAAATGQRESAYPLDQAEPVELEDVGEELAGAPVMRSMPDDF
jgi:hypothetical protein